MKTDKAILSDEKAPLTALLYVVVKNYTAEAFDWIPAILRNELEETFDVELTDLQADKLQAAILLVSTNMFETNVRAFEIGCRLAGNTPQDFEDFEPLEVEELIVGITEAYLVKNEKLEYSDEVNAYVGKICYDYGFHKAPTLFPSALMPESASSDAADDTDKNNALKEIFEARLAYTQEYMQ
jgi:hypothetical protein